AATADARGRGRGTSRGATPASRVRDLADALDALVDRIARNRRERQANVVVAAALREERFAEQKRDAAASRARKERAGAQFARRGRPQIVAVGLRVDAQRRRPIA